MVKLSNKVDIYGNLGDFFAIVALRRISPVYAAECSDNLWTGAQVDS